MRGKLHAVLPYGFRDRIIPAHAGQTVNPRDCVRIITDHPRACGANHQRQRPSEDDAGSSPRMRGKRPESVKTRSRQRIIPAHAGQTQVLDGFAHVHADHPRACGANLACFCTLYLLRGSSPRMRGKHRRLFIRAAVARIIPAHAGQTQQTRNRRPRRSDHPRACGANQHGSAAQIARVGSSPRMRGKLRRFLDFLLTIRIIPAHAGQTRTSAL